MPQLPLTPPTEVFRFYQLDVSVRADCFRVVRQAARDLGGLHHLVNCVAYFGSEGLGATEMDWERTMKVGRGFREGSTSLGTSRSTWPGLASWCRPPWRR